MFNGLIGGYVQRNRRNPFVRKVASACGRYLTWYNNANYDHDTNGEAFILRALSHFPILVVFDVGANIGAWTKTARKTFPRAAIHSFEICDKTYETLCKNMGAVPGVQCVNLGLGDREDKVKLHYYEQFPALTTVFDYPHGLPSIEVAAEVTTGDKYCEANSIDRIDFLKIDVEGMDHLVLGGFSGLLKRGAIDVIQFEYGTVNILSKFLLSDFYSLLKQYGYAIGKIYPNFVDFRDYRMTDEDFLGPNYLACRIEKAEFIRALS
jgi:FkbM family methyltransferase